MRVSRVTTLGFRNLADAEVELGAGVTLVWGSNGAGKTNLLEALYLGLAGRSPRTNSDREAIAFGEPLARVEVEVEDREVGGMHVFLCAIERGAERHHQVDGRVVDAAALAELRPALSVFMPDRLVLVKGPPAARRAHLDRFCAALWPARVEARRRYGRALAQRNALLGRIRAGAAEAGSLDAWDAELAAAGAELMEIRSAAAEELAGRFITAAADLGITGTAKLAYKPRSDAGTAAELAAELAERRRSDLDRGFTTHGPHLDELSLSRDGRTLRRYGSQGEQRLGLLALLFAEREVLVDEGRPAPMMLLDDVTSELDPERRAALCERLIAGGGQALITATEASSFRPSAPAASSGCGRGRSSPRRTPGRPRPREALRRAILPPRPPPARRRAGHGARPDGPGDPARRRSGRVGRGRRAGCRRAGRAGRRAGWGADRRVPQRHLGAGAGPARPGPPRAPQRGPRRRGRGPDRAASLHRRRRPSRRRLTVASVYTRFAGISCLDREAFRRRRLLSLCELDGRLAPSGSGVSRGRPVGASHQRGQVPLGAAERLPQPGPNSYDERV